MILSFGMLACTEEGRGRVPTEPPVEGDSGMTSSGDTGWDPEPPPCDTAVPDAPEPDGVSWYPTSQGEALGRELAIADLDGDGRAELLIAAPANYLLAGPTTSPSVYLLEAPAPGGLVDLAATTHYVGITSLSYEPNTFGYGEGIAMVPDSSGGNVVLISGTTSVRAIAFDGTLIGNVDPDAAETRFLTEYGTPDTDWLHEALGTPDVTGDGESDLVLVGSRLDDAGALYVFDGVPMGDVLLTSAPRIVVGYTGERTGTSLASGDLDGDGTAEILSGNIDNTGPGGAVVVGGMDPGVSSTDDYPRLAGEPDGYDAGSSVAVGDLDGDGAMDALVGDHIIGCGGRAYLVRGPISEDVELARADTTVSGIHPGDFLARSMATGDLDGDGQADWVIGLPRRGMVGDPPGRVAVFRGPIASGQLDESDAVAIWGGTTAADQFGYDTTTGDLDGDGRDDLVIGAPTDDAHVEYGGAVVLLPGGGL